MGKHRMFTERMEFWNRMLFQDLLEKYAVTDEEDELLLEIDTAIATVEEDSNDNGDDEEGNNVGDYRHGRKKGKGRRGGMKNMKKKMLRKRKRLARKLKRIKCQ